MNREPLTLLAMHATTLTGLRAVVTTGNRVLSHKIEDCYAPNAWLPYIAENAEMHPGLQIVMSPQDRWTPHLKAAIEDVGLPIRWVSTDFERTAYASVRHWTLGRKLYRARFLAFLYQFNRLSRQHHGYDAGKEWERHLANETLQTLSPEVVITDIPF